MSMRNQKLLQRLLGDKVIIFDKSRARSKTRKIADHLIWFLGLIFGLGIIIFLKYALGIKSGDAITILTVIISILFPVYIERIQRPELRIYAATLDKTSYKSEYFWGLKILVEHPPLANDWRSLFARSWLERRIAVGCRGTVKFFTKDLKPVVVEEQSWPTVAESNSKGGPFYVFADDPLNSSALGTVSTWDKERLATISGSVPPHHNVFFTPLPLVPAYPASNPLVTRSRELETMPARWAGSLQPSQPDAIIQFGNQSGTMHRFIEVVDIAPGDKNALDIVIQYDNDGICYGWNNETYTLSNPRMTKWKLESGQYIVELVIMYGDRSITEYFLLKNAKNTLEFKPTNVNKRT